MEDIRIYLNTCRCTYSLRAPRNVNRYLGRYTHTVQEIFFIYLLFYERHVGFYFHNQWMKSPVFWKVAIMMYQTSKRNWYLVCAYFKNGYYFCEICVGIYITFRALKLLYLTKVPTCRDSKNRGSYYSKLYRD